MFGIFKKKQTEEKKPRFKVEVYNNDWLEVREWNERTERYDLVELVRNDEAAEKLMKKCIKYPKFYEEKDGKVAQV